MWGWAVLICFRSPIRGLKCGKRGYGRVILSWERLERGVTFDMRHPYVRCQGLLQGLCRIRQALGCPLGDL